MNNNLNNDYSDFNYDGYDDTAQNKNDLKEPKKSNVGKIILVIAVIILVIGAVFGILFFVKGCDNDKPKQPPTLTLNTNHIELVVGDSQALNITISDPDEEIIWQSSDEKVAKVENGVVTAIKEGTAKITAMAYVKTDNAQTVECTVVVKKKENDTPKPPIDPVEPSEDKTKPTLTYTLSNKNEWSNSDITIKINASDKSGIASLKYALNCDSNCSYKSVSNNQLKITTTGTTKVTLLATDKKNNQTTKTFNVKIDKTAPTVKLNLEGPQVYSNTTNTVVCATCNDSLSGCVKEKYCQTFSSNQTNAKITVYDKAGNSATSYPFSIMIDTVKPKCEFSTTSLSVSRGANQTLTLTCTDNNSFTDPTINNTNFTIADGTIASVGKVEKTAVSNGYKYSIPIKGLKVGTTTIKLNLNSVLDIAGNTNNEVTTSITVK